MFPAPDPLHRQPAPRPHRGIKFWGFVGITFTAVVLWFGLVQALGW